MINFKSYCNMEELFIGFLEQSKSLLCTFPLILVCKYFHMYYINNNIGTKLLDLMIWVRNGFIHDEYMIFLWNIYVDIYPNDSSISDKYIQFVIDSSNLNILKWCSDNNFYFGNISFIHTYKSGNLNILEWATTLGYHRCTRDNFYTAIIFGHLHVLEWIYDNNICELYELKYLWAVPYDDIPTITADINCCSLAIKYRHIPILTWLHKKGFIIHRDALEEAIRDDNSNMFIYVHEHLILAFDSMDQKILFLTAIVWDRLEIIIFLRRQYTNFIWPHHFANDAATYGSMQILDYIVHNRLPVDYDSICEIGITSDSVQLIQWLMKNNYVFNFSSFVKATKIKSFKVLDCLSRQLN